MKAYPSKIIYPAAVLLFLLFVMITIHPFLAVNKPVNGEILVVEAWLPGYALEEAKKIFANGDYKYIAIAGIADDNPAKQSRHEAAKALFHGHGIEKEKILTAFAPFTLKNQTRSYAEELKRRIKTLNYDIRKLDVLTLGAHGRKSFLVFKKLFEPDIEVGIISVTPQTYNPRFWWFSVEGWQWVALDLVKYLTELIGLQDIIAGGTTE